MTHLIYAETRTSSSSSDRNKTQGQVHTVEQHQRFLWLCCLREVDIWSGSHGSLKDVKAGCFKCSCLISLSDATVNNKPVLQLKNRAAGSVTHWKRRRPGWAWSRWRPRTPRELSYDSSELREASDACCSPEDLQTATHDSERDYDVYLCNTHIYLVLWKSVVFLQKAVLVVNVNI